jgi:uncharacterized membrane protein YdfJ with MMPL/SSD domain
MLGLYASGITFVGELGLPAGITVAVAALGAITLVPALLGLAGRKIDRRQVRRRPAAEASAEPAGWQHYAERIGSHPWRYLLAGTAVLAILAIPFSSTARADRRPDLPMSGRVHHPRPSGCHLVDTSVAPAVAATRRDPNLI